YTKIVRAGWFCVRISAHGVTSLKWFWDTLFSRLRLLFQLLSDFSDRVLDVTLPPQFKCNPTRTAHVLAIVREALSNTVRHAHARRVEIEARAMGKHLVVTIRDDGQGFQLHGIERGYGLRNMYDRARLLGGTLTIDTAPGQGTTITLSAPLEEMR
ncbi:MAG TPA: hypothetical protein ENJ54_04645, partial [Chloroflexi bacterium]|nr:hypothetical protein [Chloroflexota bacterium]